MAFAIGEHAFHMLCKAYDLDSMVRTNKLYD